MLSCGWKAMGLMLLHRLWSRVDTGQVVRALDPYAEGT